MGLPAFSALPFPVDAIVAAIDTDHLAARLDRIEAQAARPRRPRSFAVVLAMIASSNATP
jgi:hypothetical protein